MNALTVAGKTALTRNKLSMPMQIIVDKFQPKVVFDYGCGKGDDIKHLEQKGIVAYGFDPNHQPEPIKAMPNLDTISCLYVLNVVENIEERRAIVLKLANMLTPSIRLFFAVRTDSFSGAKCGDGVRMSTGSFQKSYRKGELPFFILDTLKQTGRTYSVFNIDKGIALVTLK
jgi:DNA phosphorothioation-associated putative methyltransferase